MNYRKEPPSLWLGPMAGYSDSAMRRVCFQMGAEAAVSEMISAKAVVYRDRKTIALGRIAKEEGPVFIQLFGSEPAIIAEAASMIADGYCGDIRPAGIDINMGCPVPKITGNGEGSALMKNPALCHDIIKAARAALPEALPLSAKFRIGWDDTHKNAGEVATALTEGGADFLFMHGRTRAAMYAGEADWEAIEEVAAATPLPLIGNGDIISAEVAAARLASGKIYGLMIARGAIGNPFLFREIAAKARGEAPPPPPSVGERVDTALCQLRLAVEEKGERAAVLECRKQIAAYLWGLPHIAAARAAINAAESYASVEAILVPFKSCE